MDTRTSCDFTLDQIFVFLASFFWFRVRDPREDVIQAWYMDDSDEDQRLPHHREPKEFVSLDKLAELGVLSWRLDADNYETDEELKKIRAARGYSYMDFCEVCPEKLPNYDEKIKNFLKNTCTPMRRSVTVSQEVAMRLFVGDPVWTPFNRPHDHLPARKEYVETFVHGDGTCRAVNADA
ncbi:unnamed protein product [Withania somnifera]